MNGSVTLGLEHCVCMWDSASFLVMIVLNECLYKITTGLFVENTIIVAEGELQPNGTFLVSWIGKFWDPAFVDKLSTQLSLRNLGAAIVQSFEQLKWESFPLVTFARFFQVLTCGFPPMETRGVSLTVTAGLDFFGGGAIAAEERVSLLCWVYLMFKSSTQWTLGK